jgi:hypothetical protein
LSDPVVPGFWFLPFGGARACLGFVFVCFALRPARRVSVEAFMGPEMCPGFQMGFSGPKRPENVKKKPAKRNQKPGHKSKHEKNANTNADTETRKPKTQKKRKKHAIKTQKKRRHENTETRNAKKQKANKRKINVK